MDLRKRESFNISLDRKQKKLPRKTEEFYVCCGLDETRTSSLNPLLLGSYSHAGILNSPIRVPKSNEQGVKSIPCFVNILKRFQTAVIELLLEETDYNLDR